MSGMMLRAIAIATWATACGNVARTSPDAAVADRPVTDPPTVYKGHLDQTTPVNFGGGPKGYCLYSITLQQLDLQLTVEPSGQITAGAVRDLNVEMVLPMTPACPYPPSPPRIVDYAFDSAKPGPSGTMLAFQGAASNQPIVALTGTLATSGSGRSATLTFRRTDLPADPVLEWVVTATLAMQPP